MKRLFLVPLLILVIIAIPILNKPVSKTTPVTSSTNSANLKVEPEVEHSLLSEIVGQAAPAEPQPVRTNNYRYCLKLLGVDDSERSAFSQFVAATYHDPRGWSLSGKVDFTEVTDGCGYTVWLVAGQQVPTFQAPQCGWYYNCQTGSNVVVNFDRWQTAVPHWTAGLDDYRRMVVNHETGHQLGLGHETCPSQGQPAPVMQQQSISLQGCQPNSWPLPEEKQRLANLLGIRL